MGEGWCEIFIFAIIIGPGTAHRTTIRISLNATLDNAKVNGLPLTLTIIDLKNTFRFVPHKLIPDMLQHVSVPMQIRDYMADVYAKLTATISTKEWSTPPFQITRGVFQGDTLSPLLFLLCFNPVIAYAMQSPHCGFQMMLQPPGSAGLPPVGSHINVEWCEKDSGEPEGWYHCQLSCPPLQRWCIRDTQPSVFFSPPKKPTKQALMKDAQI